MRLVGWVAATLMVGYAHAASAQELAFGSETWRGHAVEVPNSSMACRVFSHFGNGDRLVVRAFSVKGESQVVMMAFLAPASLDTGGAPAPTSIGPVLSAMAKGRGEPTIRAWVDDDASASVQGVVQGQTVNFLVGALDKQGPAKFFHAMRDGSVLHVAIAGQDRKYVLRGTFAALSELVGCALKARDGEMVASDGMPRTQIAAIPQPASPLPQPAPSPVAPHAPVQPVVNAVPALPRAVRREPLGSGSGIVVTGEGHVLTNHHVIEKCDAFGLRRVGDVERRAVLLAKDGRNDLALLKAAQPYEDVASFRLEAPRLAEAVIVYGFPLANILSSSGNVTLGNVSALTGLGDDSRDVQITAAVQPGNSGGPVFDGSGLLLGVIKSKLDAIRAASITGDIPQNVNFAIRGSLAVSFLGANGIDPSFEKRRPSLPADEVMERAQKVTVQVVCYGAEK